MSGSSVLGIVVTDYHTPGELASFVDSLCVSAPQLPFAICIELVEGTAPETVWADDLAETLSDVALLAGVTFHSRNVGYNLATNDGVNWLSLVDGIDMYAIFNSDCRIKPGVLESCVELLNSDDSYGICGPRQVDDRGRLTHGGIFGTLEKPQLRGWQSYANQAYQDVRDDAVSVSGSAYFIKRSVWEELASCPIYNGVDPSAHGAFLQCQHYYGETFASYHASAHGYKCVYNGAATMIHGWHKSSPIGGIGEQNLKSDQAFFRKACDAHGIPHD